MDRLTEKKIEEIVELHERALARERAEEAEFRTSLMELDYDELATMEAEEAEKAKRLYGYHGPGVFVERSRARLKAIRDEMSYLSGE